MSHDLAAIDTSGFERVDEGYFGLGIEAEKVRRRGVTHGFDLCPETITIEPVDARS